jgi:hypothetical protein
MGIHENQKLQDDHSTRGQKQRKINETKIGPEKRALSINNLRIR